MPLEDWGIKPLRQIFKEAIGMTSPQIQKETGFSKFVHGIEGHAYGVPMEEDFVI